MKCSAIHLPSRHNGEGQMRIEMLSDYPKMTHILYVSYIYSAVSPVYQQCPVYELAFLLFCPMVEAYLFFLLLIAQPRQRSPVGATASLSGSCWNLLSQVIVCVQSFLQVLRSLSGFLKQ